MKKRRTIKVSGEFDDFTRNLKRALEKDTGRKVSLIDTTDFMARELKKKRR